MLAMYVLLIIYSCEAEISVNFNDSSKMLYQCIGPLVKDYEDHQSLSLYYSLPDIVRDNINLSYMFKVIGSKVNWSGSIVDRCMNDSHTSIPTVYILFVYGRTYQDVIKSIKSQLNYISCNEVVWKPDVKMIIVLILAFDENPLLLAHRLINILWKLYVFNCYILVIREDGSSGTIYTANPFHRFNQCGHHLTVIDKAYDCFDKNYNEDSAPSLAIPDQFPNCTLKISVRIMPPSVYYNSDGNVDGIDINFLHLIAERFRIKPKITIREELITEEQFQLQFTKKFSNYNEIALGGYPLMQDFLNNVIYARFNSEHKYFFYLCEVDDISGWQILYSTFLPKVWYSIFIILLISIIMLYLIKLLTKNRMESNFSPLLLIIGIILQQPRKIPKNNLLKIYLFSLIPTMYLLGSLYTSVLHSLTINPLPGKKIYSLDQLYRSNLSYYISRTNEFTLKNIIKTNIELPKKYFIYSDIYKVLKEISLNDQTAILESNQFIKFILPNKHYGIYRLNEIVCNLDIGIIIIKGSLFTDKLINIVNRVAQNGLYRKWFHYHINNNNFSHIKFSKQVKKQSKIADSVKVLNMSDLAPVFLLLIIGYFISFLAFTVEYLK